MLEMNKAKRFAEVVGCKNESIGEHSTIEGRICMSSASKTS